MLLFPIQCLLQVVLRKSFRLVSPDFLDLIDTFAEHVHPLTPCLPESMGVDRWEDHHVCQSVLGIVEGLIIQHLLAHHLEKFDGLLYRFDEGPFRLEAKDIIGQLLIQFFLLLLIVSDVALMQLPELFDRVGCSLGQTDDFPLLLDFVLVEEAREFVKAVDSLDLISFRDMQATDLLPRLPNFDLLEIQLLEMLLEIQAEEILLPDSKLEKEEKDQFRPWMFVKAFDHLLKVREELDLQFVFVILARHRTGLGEHLPLKPVRVLHFDLPELPKSFLKLDDRTGGELLVELGELLLAIDGPFHLVVVFHLFVVPDLVEVNLVVDPSFQQSTVNPNSSASDPFAFLLSVRAISL